MLLVLRRRVHLACIGDSDTLQNAAIGLSALYTMPRVLTEVRHVRITRHTSGHTVTEGFDEVMKFQMGKRCASRRRNRPHSEALRCSALIQQRGYSCPLDKGARPSIIYNSHFCILTPRSRT